MSLRDFIHKMPETRKELSDYILKYEHVKSAIAQNPNYKTALDDAVSKSFDKYQLHIAKANSTLAKAGTAVNYTADAWMLGTGDIVGGLGGKFFGLLAQIPEKMYGLWYAVKTGNYLDSAQNILEGAVSYLPGLTFVDQGLERIIKKRMINEALTNFEKEIGIYKPWTTKLAEKFKGVYTGVKDRSKNVFRPSYEPQPEAA